MKVIISRWSYNYLTFDYGYIQSQGYFWSRLTVYHPKNIEL